MTGLNIRMEFPSSEEIIYWSGDKKGSWFTYEAMAAWGIPPLNPPKGWAQALKRKDEAFFLTHNIQVRRRPIPEQIVDDLFVWG